MTDDNQDILNQVGAMLREARTSQGLTMLDLEVRTGLNEGVISKIENGKKNFNFTTLVKLAQGLEIPISKLLSKFGV